MNVEIYTKDNCDYCSLAKADLRSNGISFNEQKLNVNFTRDQILQKFPYSTTYPIVVVDGMNIGGYSQLKEKINEEIGNSNLFLVE